MVPTTLWAACLFLLAFSATPVLPIAIEVEFRYIKWRITERKNVGSGGCRHCVQAKQFKLKQGSNDVLLTDIKNPNGLNPTNEGPGNLRTFSGKWLDENFDSNGEAVITANAGEGKVYKFDKYEWYTANDDAHRDPRAWSLYGSDNSEDWILLDQKTVQVTDSRNSLAGEYGVTSGHPDPTASPTITRTRTPTTTPTKTETSSRSPTVTPTPSMTETRTPTQTSSSSNTPTQTTSGTSTRTPSPTGTPSNSARPQRISSRNIPAQRPRRYVV